MLFKDLLKDRMSQRNLSIKDVSTLSDVKQSKIPLYLTGAVPVEKDFFNLCEALGIDRDDVTYDEWNISVAEAAKTMGKSAEFVKQAIVKKRLPGTYVENVNGNRSFHIPRVAFMNYMNGYDEQSSALSMMFTSIKVMNQLTEETAQLHGLIKMSHTGKSNRDI